MTDEPPDAAHLLRVLALVDTVADERGLDLLTSARERLTAEAVRRIAADPSADPAVIVRELLAPLAAPLAAPLTLAELLADAAEGHDATRLVRLAYALGYCHADNGTPEELTTTDPAWAEVDRLILTVTDGPNTPESGWSAIEGADD